MQLFYQPLLVEGVHHLDTDESRHAVKVLRLKTGDEITFNYNHSESLLDNPFKCACCGNWIRGRDYIEKE